MKITQDNAPSTPPVDYDDGMDTLTILNDTEIQMDQDHNILLPPVLLIQSLRRQYKIGIYEAKRACDTFFASLEEARAEAERQRTLQNEVEALLHVVTPVINQMTYEQQQMFRTQVMNLTEPF